MSTFQAEPKAVFDPFQRVLYSLGLVLGVEEFHQEQSYFVERARLETRLLHGYGTVAGLGVDVEGLRVRVQPGLALDPLGRLIRVTPAQWADIGEWLDGPERRDALARRAEGPGERHLYVVLRYREEQSDPVLTSGGVADPQTEGWRPSRVRETFDLRLEFDPPAQPGATALRALGALLDRLEPSARVEAGVTVAEMEDLVRRLAGQGEGNAAADTSGGPLPVHPKHLGPLWSAAWRTWITEVRPRFVAEGIATGGGGERAPDVGLQLASLTFDIDAEGRPRDLRAVADGRPVVVPSAMLQDSWLRHPIGDRGETAKNADAARPHGQAGGDLGGSYPDPRVLRLHGRAISEATPADGHALVWNATRAEWEPRGTASAGTAVEPARPFASIHRVLTEQQPTFVLRLHTAEVEGAFTLEAFGCEPPVPLQVLDLREVGTNVYAVVLESAAADHATLRFVFHLHTMRLRGGESLHDQARGAQHHWLGWDGGTRVTAFAADPPPALLTVAAGRVDPDGAARGHGLVADKLGDGVFRLRVPGFTHDAEYVVRGTPVVGAEDPPHVFEVLRSTDDAGICVRVSPCAPGPSTAGFVVEISRLV